MLPSSIGNYILFTSPLLKQRHPLRWVATTLVRSNQLQMTEKQLTCVLLKHGFFSPKSPLSFHVHVTVRRDHITQWRKTEAYGTKGPLQERAKMPRLTHKLYAKICVHIECQIEADDKNSPETQNFASVTSHYFFFFLVLSRVLHRK